MFVSFLQPLNVFITLCLPVLAGSCAVPGGVQCRSCVQLLTGCRFLQHPWSTICMLLFPSGCLSPSASTTHAGIEALPEPAFPFQRDCVVGNDQPQHAGARLDLSQHLAAGRVPAPDTPGRPWVGPVAGARGGLVPRCGQNRGRDGAKQQHGAPSVLYGRNGRAGRR